MIRGCAGCMTFVVTGREMVGNVIALVVSLWGSLSVLGVGDSFGTLIVGRVTLVILGGVGITADFGGALYPDSCGKEGAIRSG